MDMRGVMSGLERTAAQSIRAEEGDYIVDGLLYCHKCHTPKQCQVEIFGEIRTPMCLCKCQAEKRDAEEAERKRIEAMHRVDRLRKMGFPDAEMRHWTFANDDHQNERISKIAQAYVENFSEMKEKGKGLLLYGTVGTGKTFISACIANALIDKIGRAHV